MARSILVFSAHAADFCSRAGGTIAKAVASGCAVHVVDATYGENGESPALWNKTPSMELADVKQRRRSEADEAALILGCTIQFLDYGDNPLVLSDQRNDELLEILLQHEPDIVLTHWRREPMNVDHATLADAVVDAAHLLRCGGRMPDRRLRRYPQILFFEPTVPFTELVGFRPDHYVDISDVWESKHAALEALASQPDLVSDYDLYGRYRAFQARGATGNRGVIYAEAFVRLLPIVVDPWQLH